MGNKNHFLIVGLRNPEPRYFHTRHNVGSNVLLVLSSKMSDIDSSWIVRDEAVVRNLKANGPDLTLAMSNYSMNENGKAVRALVLNGNNIEYQGTSFLDEHLIVIHDDIDLPFGKLRIKQGGSSGGHRGVKSVMENLGTTVFIRLKIGIGRPPVGMEAIDYVLSLFTAEEKQQLPSIYNKAVEAINLILFEGLEKAQNIVNAEGDNNGSI